MLAENATNIEFNEIGKFAEIAMASKLPEIADIPSFSENGKIAEIAKNAEISEITKIIMSGVVTILKTFRKRADLKKGKDFSEEKRTKMPRRPEWPNWKKNQ